MRVRKPTNYERMMLYFLEQKKPPWAEDKPSNRGYWTDGRTIVLNRYEIAWWHEGAVRMLMTAKWNSYLYANAIRKIEAWCRHENVLARPGERICKEHKDCRDHRVLGKACAKARFPPRLYNKIVRDGAVARKKRLKERQAELQTELTGEV